MNGEDNLYGDTVAQDTMQGSNDAAEQVSDAAESQAQSYQVPVPTIKGRKVIGKNSDGTYEFEGNVKYDPVTKTMMWDRGGMRFIDSAGMPKTIARPVPKPLLKVNPADGKTYDLTDPSNPREIHFPGQSTSGKVGEETLAGMTDQDVSTIKKMANYEWPVPPGGIRNPHQLDLLQKATLYDPSFSPSEYTIRQKARMDYSSGKSYNNIRSLNTLAGHLGNLEQSSEALHNGWNPTTNTFKNWISANLKGESAVPVFKSDVNAVTNELGQLLRGGAVTDQDVKHWNEAINSSQSPEQLKATIHEFASLAKSRLDALQQGYEGVMRKPADIQIMSPKAKQIFLKQGVLSPEEAQSGAGGVEGFGKQSTSIPAQPLTSPQPQAQNAPQGDQFLAWAKLHPNDPKAQIILKHAQEPNAGSAPAQPASP
jgi:hypothetical protein